MMDKIDILWGMYQENLTYCRHHEEQRAAITRIIIMVAAASTSIATFDQKISITDLPLALFIFILGLFGAMFSAKQYERWAHHYERSRKIRIELQKMIENLDIIAINQKADSINNKNFPRRSRWRLKFF